MEIRTIKEYPKTCASYFFRDDGTFSGMVRIDYVWYKFNCPFKFQDFLKANKSKFEPECTCPDCKEARGD